MRVLNRPNLLVRPGQDVPEPDALVPRDGDEDVVGAAQAGHALLMLGQLVLVDRVDVEALPVRGVLPDPDRRVLRARAEQRMLVRERGAQDRRGVTNVLLPTVKR